MSSVTIAEFVGGSVVARRLAGLIVVAAAVAALPAPSFAQTVTLTDDAYTAADPSLQQGNQSGSGPSIVVAGPGATLSGVPVGAATGYVKFKLTSILPAGTTEANVARATLSLYVSSHSSTSAVAVDRITGAWNENTITTGTALTLTPEVPALKVTRAQSFVGIAGLNVNNLVIRRLGAGDVLPSPAPVCFRLGILTGPGDGGAGLTTCTGSSSSIRYKTNLQPFLGGLDLIDRLKPTLFTWKASKEVDAGLIAEEVAEVAPLFTYTNDKGEIDGVKYANLTVVFINAIKEQQKQLAAQRTRLEEQDQRLRDQQQQIDALTDLVTGIRQHDRDERK